MNSFAPASMLAKVSLVPLDGAAQLARADNHRFAARANGRPAPERVHAGVYQSTPQFPTISALGADKSDMRIFHRRFKVGKAPFRGLDDDRFAIWRPFRTVFGVLGGIQAPDPAAGDGASKHILIEEAALIHLAIRDKRELHTLGRRADGMLVMRAIG